MDACPFCSPAPDRIFYQDSIVIGIWDAFPVSPGHALLIPKPHVRSWFEASLEERLALTRAIDVARFAIEANFRADGYNIGINSGEAAGQTIFHLHVHVIPRVLGDVPDPRGGVRHVISHKGNYLVPSTSAEATEVVYSKALFTGGQENPLLPHLVRHLADSKSADMAVAFTMRSGLELLQPHLQDLQDRGGSLRILIGDYLGTTDPDALLRLIDLDGGSHAVCTRQIATMPNNSRRTHSIPSLHFSTSGRLMCSIHRKFESLRSGTQERRRMMAVLIYLSNRGRTAALKNILSSTRSDPGRQSPHRTRSCQAPPRSQRCPQADPYRFKRPRKTGQLNPTKYTAGSQRSGRVKRCTFR